MIYDQSSKVESYKFQTFIEKISEELKKRDRLVANFTTFHYIEDLDRAKIYLVVSVRPHRVVLPIRLSVDAVYGSFMDISEYYAKGGTYSVPVTIALFEEFYKDQGLAGAVLDLVLRELEKDGALGPANRKEER